MIPRVVQFDSEGPHKHVTNQAWALCNNFDSVVMPDASFGPRLLLVLPEKEKASSPLVSDPPPMVA